VLDFNLFILNNFYQIMIPPEIKTCFNDVNLQVKKAHIKWEIFRQLYLKNKKRIELLNESAAGFFAILRKVFIDDVILSICRLTDPKKSSGKENSNLAQLVEMIYPCSQLELFNGLKNDTKSQNNNIAFNLSQKLEKILGMKEVGKFKEYRNKRIAHSDLEMLMLPSNLLDDTYYSEVDETLICCLMQAYEYGNRENKLISPLKTDEERMQIINNQFFPKNFKNFSCSWLNGKYKDAL